MAPCPRCGREFSKPARLAAHLKDPCGDQLQCLPCKKRFASYAFLRKHNASAHNAAAPEADDGAGPSGVFQCDQCDKSYGRKKSLQQHKRSHARKWVCIECSATYARNEDLRHHIDTKHTNPGESYPCPRCSIVLNTEDGRYRHFDKEHHGERICDTCHSVFKDLNAYNWHYGKCKQENGAPTTFPCLFCRNTFPTHPDRETHLGQCKEKRAQQLLFRGAGVTTRQSDDDDEEDEDKDKEEEEEEEDIDWVATYALNRNVGLHSAHMQNQHDLGMCLVVNKAAVINKVRHHASTSKQGIKFLMAARVSAAREVPVEGDPTQVEVEKKTIFLRSNMHTVLKDRSAAKPAVEEAFQEVLAQADHMNLKGSGWVLASVMALDLNVALCEPLRGSSFIPTPDHLKNAKKALLNIRNFGNSDCFRLSVAAALHPADHHKTRAAKYTPFVDELNMGNINYLPMKIKNIPKFEKLNPTISICVLYEDTFEEKETEEEDGPQAAAAAAAAEARLELDNELGEEEEEEEEDDEGEAECLSEDEADTRREIIVPLYCTKEKKENHITLLLLERAGQHHYVLIQDIHAFLFSQTSKKVKSFYCCYCLNFFPSAERLDKHESICRTFGAQRVEYAKPGSTASFNNFHFPKLQRVPFTAYYDFEAALKRVDADEAQERRRSNKIQDHDPIAYSIAIVNWKGELVKHVTHSAEEDVAQHFVTTILELEEEMWAKRPNFKLNMSAKNEEDFAKARVCYLCKQPFKKKKKSDELDKVRDHDHLEAGPPGPDSYRGAACGGCNSAVHRTTFFPLIGHGASHYDMHFLFRAFIKHPAMAMKRISVLAKTMDTYRSAELSVKEGRTIKLLDSFNFFSTSLDSITRHLEDADLGVLRAVYPDPAKMALVRTKNLFCYEWVDSYKRLQDQTTLPARQDFFSSLTGEVPSEEDYQRAQSVYDGLGCKSLLEYMLHYLNGDVLLLSAFFTKFKAMTFAKYGLEVCHFVSISSLTWWQALKFTGEKVPIITDPDIYQLFERQKRGGLACIMRRYSEANVPGTTTFDPSMPEKHIQIYDVNALYSNEMCKKLPFEGYRWASPQELAAVDWSKVGESDEEMYTVEVSLEYPAELHAAHDEWPCAVERIQVPEDWLSPYQQRLARNLPPGQLREQKLIAHLGSRKNYVVHGAVLGLYLKLGLRVTEYHCGVKYTQKAWLKPYIEDLMMERQKTSLAFEQQAYKQFSNSTYGYLLRNPRHDRQVEIVRTPQRMRKLAAKPNFKGFTIFGDDLVAVEKTPAKIRLTQCVSAGVSVLDTSKKLMMELYWALKGQFGARMNTLFTDTDSVGVEIESPDIVSEMRNLSDILDTSGLRETHPLYSTQFARVQGRLKIEYGQLNILRFAAVRAKCYALEMESEDQALQNVLKCKGVDRRALKRAVSFADYKKCIFEDVVKQVRFCSIRTDGAHNLGTIDQTKIALRNYDGKRYINDDGYTTRAFCSAVADVDMDE